jgi:glutamyl-tRNA reductase
VPSIILVGLNHHTAAIDLREQFSLDGCGLRMALDDLRTREVVILSTCNRLEIYALVEDVQHGWDAIARYLAQARALAPTVISRLLYFRQGREAIAHLLRVACGLDSLILGEPQILGQVAAAAAEAQVAGAIGPTLSHLFNQALHCGKRARTETAIGSYTTSISHAAAQLAVNRLGGLATRHALVLGAGEMAELAAVAAARCSFDHLH